ncbi:MAG: type II secretion system F family protein [Acidobacteria bacterium]|nr:type II secretion system F family protein [Acidobacteriota bacterium]
MQFRCRLGTDTGEIVEGVYTADTEAKLRRDLEDKGLYVLSIRRRGVSGLPAFALPRRRRVASRDFIVFNQELAALLRAGIPLVQSLDIVRQRAENPVLKAVLDDVYERVRGGAALSAAFEVQGDLFPGVYTASVLAGEKSGGLEEVLRRYIAYARVISSVRRRTISALVYPGILLLLSLVVVAVIVLQVVPEFGDFYAGMGAELPLATRILTSVSTALRESWLLILAASATVAGVLWRWLARPGRRALLDRMLVRAPAVGSLARKFATSQLARTLATLLGGGIPLVGALDVAARSIGNRHVAEQVASVSREVREGRALADSMAARGVFPPVAVRMVEVGESSGALQEMLNSTADFFDEEIETTLSRFMTLIEPVLLVVMGVVIAALLLALYWPLLQLGSVVQ